MRQTDEAKALDSTSSNAEHERGGQPMKTLGDFRTYAKLPAKDIGRAKRFYAERLGLRSPRELAPGHFMYDCGGSIFLLFASQGKASGSHDQMGWLVDDVSSQVRELKGRGVVFETFDYPGNTWAGEVADNGIRRAAWFRDSEGNLFSVTQLLAASVRQA